MTLSFEQVERIIGDKLPESAVKHRAWCSNETHGVHVSAHAWIKNRVEGGVGKSKKWLGALQKEINRHLDWGTKNMSQEYDRMVKALQIIVVPKLRERGFKGSFPHFRRPSKGQIDLLTFQFDKWGGGFVIEISKCPADGITTYFDEHIPPNKVTAWHIEPTNRFRLQPGQDGSPASWFRYDYILLFGDIFEKTAKKVLPFLDKAEKWWNG